MTAALDQALEMIRSLVQSDGYDARIDDYTAGELKLTILAGPQACAECLVPKELMATIIAASLPPELAGSRITLTYPSELH